MTYDSDTNNSPKSTYKSIAAPKRIAYNPKNFNHLIDYYDIVLLLTDFKDVRYPL